MQQLAHGFGARYDLPVPLALYLGAAAAVIVITFAGVATLLRPHAQGPEGRGGVSLTRIAVIGAVFRSRIPRIALGFVGVFALVATIVTGYAGFTAPTSNPAEYIVWIYFWAGTLVVAAMIGNIYSLLNPWSALYDAVTWCLRRQSRGLVAYRQAWSIWPAVAGYSAFAWFELASGQSQIPAMVATATVVYTGYTLLMMVVFGRTTWLTYGETFSVLFRLVGAFGPVAIAASGMCAMCTSNCSQAQSHCVDCEECYRAAPRESRDVVLRPWSTGLLRLRDTGWAVVVFIILTVSSLAFDGITATPPWRSWVSEHLDAGPRVIATAGLLCVTLAFLAVFVVTAELVRRITGLTEQRTVVAALFAYTLVPIALVYNAAHNYSYIVVQSQGIIPLLADPLQNGANLLPTGGYLTSFALADAQIVWYIQIALIVGGHMIAVYLAHRRALILTAERRRALVGQLPMLLLMVAYTMTSLWILSQPITER